MVEEPSQFQNQKKMFTNQINEGIKQPCKGNQVFFPTQNRVNQNKSKPYIKNETNIQKGEKQFINLEDVITIYNTILFIDFKWERHKNNSNDKKYTNKIYR